MENTNELFPIYRELIGYLSQIHQPKDAYETIKENSGWDKINDAIIELESLTGKSYNRFKIKPESSHSGGYFTYVTNIRTCLGGIVEKLHAEYFNDQPDPFSGKPNSVTNNIQNQEQSQSTHIQMIIDLTTTVTESLNRENLKPEERSFLEQIKSGLSGIKSAVELINLILTTGAALGLSVSQIASLLVK